MRLTQVSQSKMALGGKVLLSVVSTNPVESIEELFTELWRQVFTFERRFSRFLPGSELSALNRSAGIKTFVTPKFKALLVMAKDLSLSTGGLYNPFILPALQRAGYVKSAAKGYETDAQEDYSVRSVVSIEHLDIGSNWVLIPYGTALDLGGCGKGYLADLLGENLRSRDDIKGYWLSIGGDIATFGHDQNGHKLNLDIQDASNLDSTTDWLINCPSSHFGVATSGTFRRPGHGPKNNWHHIINPKTGQPALSDIRLATVCAKSAAEADVLASCAVILGSKKATAWLKKHSAVSALLQCTDDTGVILPKKFGRLIKKIQPEQLQTAVQNA